MGEVVSRLGHVLGWTGNTTALLVVAIAIGAVGYQAWNAWDPEIKADFSYEITTPAGQKYVVIGNGYGHEDALAALKKHLGEKVDHGPYGDWTILPNFLSRTPEQENALKAAQDRRYAEEVSKFRKSALDNVILISVLAAILSIGVFLFGRACRYVLSGPSK